LTEANIIQGCINEDPYYQKILFERYSGRMMTLCLRYSNFQKQDAEDILQEGFIRIYDKIALYRDFGSFEGWMKRIFINIAIRRNQNLKKKASISLTLEEGRNSIQLPHAIENLSAEQILAIIENLPEGYRIVFNLYEIDGYSHAEIAQILGIKAATSRSQLTKAKILLKKMLTAYHTDFNLHTPSLNN